MMFAVFNVTARPLRVPRRRLPLLQHPGAEQGRGAGVGLRQVEVGAGEEGPVLDQALPSPGLPGVQHVVELVSKLGGN